MRSAMVRGRTFGGGSGLEVGAGGVVVLRILMAEDRGRLGGRQRGTEGALGGLANFFVHLLLEALEGLGVEDAFAQQVHLEIVNGIAEGFGLALGFRAIEADVVGVRVRVGADDVAVDQRGTFAGAAVGDGGLEGGKAGERVGAVDFGEMEVGEVSEQRRDVAAGGVDLDRNGDGVAVVFDDEEDGELEIGGDADGFPELAFAGGAIAEGDVDDFVAVEVDVLELAVVARVAGSAASGCCWRGRGRLPRSRPPGGTGSRWRKTA